MKIFETYSQYYNLLYKDKDYKLETDYIDQLVKKYLPKAKTILDLGCGTGLHAKKFCEMGYLVHGVDFSEEMINSAKSLGKNDVLEFSYGDIRKINLNKEFDIVTSLFHVVSYQTTNNDILNTFNTVYNHLKNNGIFIFDCWYGPGVLTNLPIVRIKEFKDKDFEITRISEPSMNANTNVVNVHFKLFVRNKFENTYKTFKEMHTMRYLFKPEIDLLLEKAGLNFLNFFEFLTFNEPGYGTWNVCFIARKTHN